MRVANRGWRVASLLLVMALAAALPGFAATLTVQLDSAEVNVGDPITLTISVENGAVGDVTLPKVDGLAATPQVSSSTTYSFSAGTYATTISKKYQLVASHPGDFTIPAFDVPLQGGETLRSKELQIHVRDSSEAPATNAATAQTPSPADATPASTTPEQAPAGPVIMPPSGANPNDAAAAAVPVPRDKDGGPAKVFIVIMPDTTDAYVDQAVPLRIDCYIREEVNADQNSLPTIKGIDFLMNNLSERSHMSLLVIEGEQYECDTWLTAISAPKCGDFPLASERDTYWQKSISSSSFDPFGFSRHDNLAHEVITSNQLTMHIHPLPAEGRPDHFTGAIGQFQVQGDAQPATVEMGEPVTLTFSVAGVGNFDYVRCPVLGDDKNWKTYTPVSSTSFNSNDETRTHAAKTFEQSVIPQENGNVPLPAATFSYFDPLAKRYITVPISLPTIAVTGAMPVSEAAPPAASGAESTATATVADELLPNRADLGSLEMSMSPAYWHRWFWIAQGSLALLPFLGLLVFFMRQRVMSGQDSTETASHLRSLRQQEQAMAEALRRNDALAFFVAARHAVQIQLGAQWATAPEAITLGEIRRRDPALAGTLAPLFGQADEVIYSGRADAGIDLAHWDALVRDFLQLQPA